MLNTKIIMISFSVSSVLPSGQLSNVPWRRADVKYTNNEAYFDLIEEVDAIIDKAGGTVFAEISGDYLFLFSINNHDDQTKKHVIFFLSSHKRYPWYCIAGRIDCCVRLSGTPDLNLSFVNPRIMDDVSFHPCVRLKRWETERLLSFVPPDGNFRLMEYHVGSQSVVAIPIYVRSNFYLPKESQQPQTGKIDVTVGPRQTIGRVVSNISLSLKSLLVFY